MALCPLSVGALIIFKSVIITLDSVSHLSPPLLGPAYSSPNYTLNNTLNSTLNKDAHEISSVQQI